MRKIFHPLTEIPKRQASPPVATVNPQKDEGSFGERKTVSKQSQAANKAWGGVFEEAADPRMEKFSESISFDRRLYRQDIRGSQAHAKMLAKVGVLTADEAKAICDGLDGILADIEAGNFEYSIKLEDIHMHVEKELINRIGDTGRKLHTGRSRNDQVSTDFRLWVRDAIDKMDSLLKNLQKAFIGRCDEDFDCILPGFTHTQRAQPVLAPHYWLCYVEKFARDRERLADCRKRTNTLSLGAAALAGTSIPIDRFETARLLEFERVAANSLDVSSDRDFALEFTFCLAVIAEHLSTWAEEWILWSTCEFNFIKLPQKFCTGSSIMPQKVNPDLLELIRGKTARVIGDLQTLMVLVKGLLLAYNRDLQEDKTPVFDAFDTVSASLDLAADMVRDAKLNREAINERLEKGYLDATTFMEFLIKRGIPQRTAHGMVGRLVRSAMNRGIPLAELPLQEFQAEDPSIDDSVYEILGVRKAIDAFQSYGSTAANQVRYQIDTWKKNIEF
ncbi:MAG: argininosuccinate lyase [Thermoguttaceae bacterium]|nr:argininosuccinate lyase [Thermoguttaceae bacterium]